MEYKETVEYIINKGIHRFDSKILDSYVLFLVSNKDFKYNQSYFIDGFEDFRESILLLCKRFSVYKKVILSMYKIQKKITSIQSTTIVFDSIYKYNLPDSTDVTIKSDVDDFTLHNYCRQPWRFECVVERVDGTVRHYSYSIDKKNSDQEVKNKVIEMFKDITNTSCIFDILDTARFILLRQHLEL